MPILFAATAAERDSRHSLLRPLSQSGSFFRLTLTPPFLPPTPTSSAPTRSPREQKRGNVHKKDFPKHGLPFFTLSVYIRGDLLSSLEHSFESYVSLLLVLVVRKVNGRILTLGGWSTLP